MERSFHSRPIASLAAALGLALALCFELASASCAANQFIVVSDTGNNCVPCTAGSRCDGTTLTGCGNGLWSAWSAGSCSACSCPPGAYCSSAPSAALNCNSCPAGSFCVNSLQQACPAGDLQCCGSFMLVSLLVVAGTWSAAGTTVCANCNCPAGTGCYASSSACTICTPGGRMSDLSRSSYCFRSLPGTYCVNSRLLSCPIGTYSVGGATNIANCTACESAQQSSDVCCLVLLGSKVLHTATIFVAQVVAAAAAIAPVDHQRVIRAQEVL
jgi:hypothetical protein